MSFSDIFSDASRYGNWRKPTQALRLLFLCPGFQLVFSVRLQRALLRIPVLGLVLNRLLWYFSRIYFGCDISPDASFGPGLYIPHAVGIVVGGEWSFGSNVTILQGVTVGRSRIHTPERRYSIGDNVVLGAGAKVLGEFDIGENALVGANAVVLSAVPENTTAVGVPARIISSKIRTA
jgi:serine O-acetyltransferase